MAIRIEECDGGWVVVDEATGRRGVAVTPASVAKRVRELIEAPGPPASPESADMDEAGGS